MKISIKDMNIEKFYPQLKEIGFDGLDVGFLPWSNREAILGETYEALNLKKYKAIKAAGLKVCQTHLTYYPSHLEPLGSGGYEDFEEYMLPIILKEIEMSSKMNCRCAVMHLYFDQEMESSRQKNVKLISKLLPALEKHNVILCIENIYGPHYGNIFLSTAEDLLYYIDYFKSEYLGICMDTGHAITGKVNPIEMLEKLHKNVKALHVHTNVFGRDLHLPPGFTYDLETQRFYDTLMRVGYEGTFNLEVVPPSQMNLKTALKYYDMVYGIAEGITSENKRTWKEE